MGSVEHQAMLGAPFLKMRRLFNTPNLLRLYRVGVLVVLGWLVHSQARWFELQQRPAVSIQQARKFFPTANRVQLRDPGRGLHYVTDSHGDTVGVLLTTSPQTDNIIGYSGPNNVLIALDTNGAIAGLEILRSSDTEEHIELVRRDAAFLRAFVGWKPGEAPPKVAAVAGATLTSFAVTEAVQQRLAGAAASLRFPEPVTLEEVRRLFTNATYFAAEGRRFRVFDSRSNVLGYALHTSPEADNVRGYRGPTDALLSLALDGKTVTGVRVRRSYETPSYVDQIRDDDYYLKLFRGRTLEELAALDFKNEKIEGVSGATMTSYAIAEGLKRRAAAEIKPRANPDWRPRPRDYGLAAVIAGALVMAFTSLRGHRWIRLSWQLVLVGYVGLMNADLLSVSLLSGWAVHGAALKAAPGLVLLATAALFIPLFSRRQLYCHQICPHGAAQQLLGSVLRRRWSVPPRVAYWLEKLPSVLLFVALLVLLLGWRFNLAALEPFDAWAWRAAGLATLGIAGAGLFASLFIPQAYCRFGCPTGALLNFVRSTGSADHWGRRDFVALFFVSVAITAIGAIRSKSAPASEPATATMSGYTMGTTWTVKTRDFEVDVPAMQEVIADKFEWCEQMTSHWRTNTEITQFNRARSTNAIYLPEPLVSLARSSTEISRASDGAFDITVGPLVRLWGFGPAPRRTEPPSNLEISALLPAVGWQKLEVLDGALRKQNPDLEMDLSAIAPGWAIDQIAALLEFRGCTNFLIESGGELRARGAWPIAIEHPTRTITLRDESIGTSGSYRQNWKSGGKAFSHLIDPRTGHPITHRTVTVSVRHPSCAQADAWAAALNILGQERGQPLAERLSLAAQFVVEQPDGKLEVRATSHWHLTDHGGTSTAPAR